MKKPKRQRRNPPEAFLSKTPWRGFARGDAPRAAPLASCPDARCRRAKSCIAAQAGLFCQRTHFSPRDRSRIEAEQRRDFAQRWPSDLEALVPDLMRLRLEGIIAERRAEDDAMTARWKAGLLDHLYGKYRAGGVLLPPPPKVYREEG